MTTIQPEVLKHVVSIIAEMDPAKLNDREVIAYLAGISETATGMLQLKPDLKAHADLVMDLANRVFHATKEAEARGYRMAIERLRDAAAVNRWIGREEQAGRFEGYRIGLIEYLEATEGATP